MLTRRHLLLLLICVAPLLAAYTTPGKGPHFLERTAWAKTLPNGDGVVARFTPDSLLLMLDTKGFEAGIALNWMVDREGVVWIFDPACGSAAYVAIDAGHSIILGVAMDRCASRRDLLIGRWDVAPSNVFKPGAPGLGRSSPLERIR